MSGHEDSHHDADDGKGGANPFDDYDFSQVKTRRERAKLAKENAKDEAEKPLVANMDAEAALAAATNNELMGKK
jgi:hypothetical protein